MLIFKFYAAENSKTGEGAIRQGNAEKNKPVAALNKFGLRKAFPKFIFLFFEQNGSVPLTSAAVANFATENCI